MERRIFECGFSLNERGKAEFLFDLEGFVEAGFTEIGFEEDDPLSGGGHRDSEIERCHRLAVVRLGARDEEDLRFRLREKEGEGCS